MAREVYRKRLAGYFKNAMSFSENGPVNHGGLWKGGCGKRKTEEAVPPSGGL